MIDIHSHILPAIDDGAQDMAESISMAKIAVKDGISTIFATPHITAKTAGRAFIADQVAILQNSLTTAGIKLHIALGGEIPFYLGADFGPFCLGDSRFLLLELPHSHVPDSTNQKIYELRILGYKVIIAHPERNGDIIRNPDLLKEMLDCGALAQITAGSVTGDMGTQAQHCAHHLLRQKMVHFIASDSHSSLHRTPLLGKAVTMAGRIIGKEEAHKLVFENPQQIIKPPAQQEAHL